MAGTIERACRDIIIDTKPEGDAVGAHPVVQPGSPQVNVGNRAGICADDFICTNTGPITDIHLWGSWLNDRVGTNSITFWLGIYDDVPASPLNGPSHPGNLKWQQWFTP